jgi:hypothetical protein
VREKNNYITNTAPTRFWVAGIYTNQHIMIQNLRQQFHTSIQQERKKNTRTQFKQTTSFLKLFKIKDSML